MRDWLRNRWLDISIRRHTIKHKLIMWIVWELPRGVVELAAVRVWANATTGKFGTDEPQYVTMDEGLKRWRGSDGGDRTHGRDSLSY